MTRLDAEKQLKLWDRPAVFVQGFDEAIMGLGRFQDGGEYRVIHNEEMCLNILARTMTWDQAVSYYESEIRDAHVCYGAPVYVSTGAFQ